MKRLLVVLTLIFVSLNIVACSQKKDSKTRLTRGSGRESAIQGSASYGWSVLNQQAEETELYHQDPDFAARAFIGNDSKFIGPSLINSIAMKLVFQANGQVNSNATMAGLRFHDDIDNPLAYFLGASMNRRASGSKNGNTFNVIFADVNEEGQSLGNVIISGRIEGANIRGTVTYDGGHLGEFTVSTNGAIFY
jgi:hypothetical protein